MKATFFARRSDGFGERLRGIVNALALRRKYGGSFAFQWSARRLMSNPHHDIRPGKEVFSAEFFALCGKPPGAVLPFRDFTSALASRSLSDLGDAYIDTPKFVLANHDPEEFGDLTPKDYRDAFDEIGFSRPLMDAIALARQVPLAARSSAVHARAGDIIYGRWRFSGQFARKVIPYPVVFAHILARRAAGEDVLLFGQDQPLCRQIADITGAIDVCALHAQHGLTSLQAAIFDIFLMSRCQHIASGMSGFALIAQIIGGARRTNPVFDLPVEATLDPLMSSLVDGKGPHLRPHPLQQAFACWFAYDVYLDELTPAQRLQLLTTAARLDPDNLLYKVGLSVDGGQLNALRDSMVAPDPEVQAVSLLDVLGTKTGLLTSAIHMWEDALSAHAIGGSVEAAAMIAVVRDEAADAVEARRFAKLAGHGLPGPWQERIDAILAS